MWCVCVCVCVCLEEYLEMGEIKMEIVGKISKGGVFRGLVEGKSKLRFGVKGFPGGSVVKNLPANAGDMGLIPGLGRSPGEGNGNPLQYSCLGNPMDREAWRAAVPGVTKSQTRLSN